MKNKRRLAPNEIEARGEELLRVIDQLRAEGKTVSSIERIAGTNAGWIVRWFRPRSAVEPVMEKQVEMFPIAVEISD